MILQSLVAYYEALAQKGVVEKVISPRDRRECRLRVGAEYRKKTLDAPGRVEALMGELTRRFTRQELEQLPIVPTHRDIVLDFWK